MVKNLHLERNQVVYINSNGGLVGTIKFIGRVGDQTMVGVRLGEGTGDSDGTVEGVRYFDCDTNGGIFVKPTDISKVITPEEILTKIRKLNGKKKDNDAKINELKDQLTILAGDNPVPQISGSVQKLEGDSDDVILNFLNEEIRKKWYIGVRDVCARYPNRKENEVVNLYKPKEKEFSKMDPCNPHSRIVYTVSSNPKDNLVASGSDDKSIRLWRRNYNNPNSGEGDMRCIAELKLRSCINSLAFHPNQDMLAAALDSGWIELYDLKTGKMMGALEGQSTSEVWTVCFSPDGSNILSGSLDRAIRVWDVRDRECKWALRGHDEWVNGIAVSSDGTTIVSGSGDKTVRIWDTKTMGCRSTLRGHEDFVRSVCVTGDNQSIVSASDDCSLKVWDVKNGTQKSTIKAHSKGIYCVSSTASGGRVVSSSRDFAVKIWDVNSGSSKPVKVFNNHRGDVNSCCFFDNGRWVASCSDDKKVLCFQV